MADSYTANFSLQQPQVNADLNVWGGYLNNGMIAAVDAALGATTAISMTSSDVTLTTGAGGTYNNAIFEVNGAITADRQLIIPFQAGSSTVACGGRFVVINNTTNAHRLTVITQASGSSGVTVPQGFSAFLFSDGTNVGYATIGVPGFAIAVNGNPNGQLAGTAGSINTNAQLAHDYTNNILYVCVLSGTTSTAVWANAVSASAPLPTPEGYLTLFSGIAIIPSDAIAETVIYYTPFLGSSAAVHNGVSIVPYRFIQLPLVLTASQAANNIYDIFLAYNGGTPVIGTGPAWSGPNTRGTAINRDAVTGLWVNTSSMSLIYNIGAGNNTITVAGGQGIFLGSMAMDATNGQVSCYRSFGASRKWGVSNAYNRQTVILGSFDSTASWTSANATPHPSNNNTANSVQIFSCLAEEEYDIEFIQRVQLNPVTGLSAELNIGIGVDATNSFISGGLVGDFLIGIGGGAVNVIGKTMATAKYTAAPTIGTHTVTALEAFVSGGTATFYGTAANMRLAASWRA